MPFNPLRPLVLLALAALLPLAPAYAQERPATPLPDMQAIAAALGVQCEYCHGQRNAEAPVLTPGGKPRLEVAREMIAMTAELNARVATAAGKTAAQAVKVDCVTCHRGVAIPRQLRDIMWQATLQQGPEAAAALYRDLRTRYYGRQSYDFGEETLLGLADRLAQARPVEAIALANLNIEFFPASARSYLVKGIAQTRRIDNAAAIESFKKAIELNPSDVVAKGWLYQLEELATRRR